jgi:hypothetical protein
LLASTRSYLESIGFSPPGGSGEEGAEILIAYIADILGTLPGAEVKYLEEAVAEIRIACE